VVSTDPSYIEVVLKVKGATESEDKEFSRLAKSYRIATYISGLYPSKLSTLELRVGLVADSVEATVHVKVTGGSWPVGFKGEVSAANARNEVSAPGCPLTTPLRLYKASGQKTLGESAIFQK
jgi:hypothetical protein